MFSVLTVFTHFFKEKFSSWRRKQGVESEIFIYTSKGIIIFFNTCRNKQLRTGRTGRATCQKRDEHRTVINMRGNQQVPALRLRKINLPPNLDSVWGVKPGTIKVHILLSWANCDPSSISDEIGILDPGSEVQNAIFIQKLLMV
jgi:hypothetical protein